MRVPGAILLALLALLAAAAATLWWFPAPLLATVLRLGGLETVRFADLRLGAGTLAIDDLQIGTPPAQRIARIRLHYRPLDLLRGRLASLEIAGLELRARLVDGRLELPGLPTPQDSDEPAALPALPWPEKIALRDSEIRLTTPWGELQAPLSAELLLDAGSAKLDLALADGALINDAGRLRADLTLTGSAPLDRTPDLADLTAEGRLTLAAKQFALPDRAGGIEGQAEATFALAAGRLDARLDADNLQVAEPAMPLRAALPPPWRIAPTAPLQISADLTGDRPALALDGALQLTAGPATLGLDLATRLAGDMIGGRATLSLNALRWPSATLEHGTLALAGDGTSDHWQGTLDLQLAGSARPTPEIALRGTTLRHQLAIRWASRQLVLSPRDDGALAFERLAWQDKGEAGPLAFTLPTAAAPLLTAIFSPTGEITWQHRLRAAGAAFDFSAAGGLQGRAALAALTLALDGDRSGLTGGQVALADGRLRLPAWQVTLEGIASEIALAPAGLAAGQTIPLTVQTISQGATPAWFAPLTLHATLRPDPGALRFDARLGRPNGTLELTLHGRHSLADGRGRAAVALAPLTFAPGQLQPRTLAPAGGDLLADVAGTLALDGSIAWGEGAAVTADLALLLDELAFTAGPARFSQVNGVIDLDRLWPPGTPPGQQVAIGLVDLGLPLTRGLLAFQLLPEGALAVERLRWDFAGGTVAAAPFTVGSAASDIIATLNAERLDLAQLFALTRLDGLSGEGTIRGTLPLRVSGVEAVIEGGELRATGPGWLRYRSDGVPAALQAGGENVSLLLQALENFRYEALRITLDGRTDAEMDIGLHVKGANPDLYDGYPIEFNLDLEGELANILRSGLASYQIPERIRERMQGFRR